MRNDERGNMTRSIWIAALLVIEMLAGCDRILGKEQNPDYCPAHPDDIRCRTIPEDAPTDVPSGCTSNAGCVAPDGVCVISTGACVECTSSEAGACLGTTPVCGSDDACRGCTSHGECPSKACMPDGSCADETNVAYVAPTGTGTTCTKATPCGTLDNGVKANRPVVKLAAGLVKDTKTTSIDGKAVTILADTGAQLDRDGDGAVLEVKSANADVRIYDLEITGATGISGGDGIDLTPNGGTPKLALVRVKVDANQGLGVAATGGSLTVTQSTIATNQGGGISVSGSGATFDIRNNFIYRNGDQDAGTFGGLNLGIAVAGSNRFEFNTIVDNRAAINSGGVVCNVGTFMGPNNIIARNSLAGSTTAASAQTSGACTYPTSTIANVTTGLAFSSADAQPYNYHLTSGSTAIDHGTTATTTTIDFDGDARPQGAADDQGADEYK